MKLFKSKSDYNIFFVFLFSFLTLGIIIYTCGSKKEKAEILEASTAEASFWEEMIAENSFVGITDTDK